MDFIEAILLGLIQGITEFLPISSSGHLVLARSLFGRDLASGITFEIVVHFGSFCSIVVYYRKMIAEILGDLLRSISPTGIKSGEYRTNSNAQFSYIILLSMIPAFVVGMTLKDQIEQLFNSPFFVSWMLIVTGVLLFLTRFVKKAEESVSAGRGFLMGVAQAFAIIPGISRSGSTISVGLFSGVSRYHVANFSFLMVLPVLAGAMALEVLELFERGVDPSAVYILLTGFLTSFLSGYLALSYLITVLRREKFFYFAYYCWAIGIAGIFYFY